MKDLWAALALVAVLEGLLLFAFPSLWKRTAEQLLAMPARQLRLMGGLILAVGLVALTLVRR
ncbi:MAG: DUF2065 family protein [Xanthomonadales bacterium]|jgi:uncharacterized protein YjeT (DUF2065 family)|nr:DUF2065 family protein [Xanthomonadales bacterium]